MGSAESEGRCLEISGEGLTVEAVARIARRREQFDYRLASVGRIEASYALRKRLVEQGRPIYGVTTGFGDSVKRQIASQKAAELQRNLLKMLGNGVGPMAAEEVVRATLLIRANCLARGNSGVRVEVITGLLECLRHDILPVIPERGSVGASGDLVPLSYLGSVLLGEGRVHHRGKELDAAEALATAGLKPLVLEAKEGLALVNGTSFMSAFACLALVDAEELAFISDLCTAMITEALCGNRGSLDLFVHLHKPHPGQVASARTIDHLLAGSGLARKPEELPRSNPAISERGFVELEHPLQDKYSIRCAPQVTGVLHDTLEWAKRWVNVEINSSNDNPLFDAERGEVHNGGNFYGGHIGQAMDSLKVAVANIADLLDRQLELIVDEKFNRGLTPNLIPRFEKDDPQAGLHHGFKGMQIACSSLVAEALKLASPASVFSRSTEAHNQDKVSMATIAARDARTINELTRSVAAIHLIALCQALELRGPEKMSHRTRAALELLRQRVPFLERDRRMEGDIHSVVELIRTGDLRRAVLGGENSERDGQSVSRIPS